MDGSLSRPLDFQLEWACRRGGVGGPCSEDYSTWGSMSGTSIERNYHVGM